MREDCEYLVGAAEDWFNALLDHRMRQTDDTRSRLRYVRGALVARLTELLESMQRDGSR